MRDSNWDLINGEVAHEIEFLNYTSQINVIEALFKLLSHYESIDANGDKRAPNCKELREIHRTGTLFLLEAPGEYRNIQVYLRRADGTIVHMPPPPEEVGGHMEQFEQDLTMRWEQSDPLDMAAFTLWKINWIHPFKNGNGRSARAFAYACLCLKFGFWLPGFPTVIDLIMENKGPYDEALSRADAHFASTGNIDLSDLKAFLETLLRRQLGSITQTN